MCVASKLIHVMDPGDANIIQASSDPWLAFSAAAGAGQVRPCLPQPSGDTKSAGIKEPLLLTFTFSVKVRQLRVT
jgi:hypothetical protein